MLERVAYPEAWAQSTWLKSRLGRIAASAVLAAVYVLTGKLGLSLASLNASATAVWPPTGISIAAMLVLGIPLWPGVLVGAFLTNFLTQGTIATSLGIAAGNTLEAVIAVWLVQRLGEGLRSFQQARGIGLYMLLAAGVAPMVSATTGVVTLAFSDLTGGRPLGAIWLTWWLGDAVSAMTLTPFLVTWVTESLLRRIRNQGSEAALLLASLVLVGLVAFGGLTIAPYNRYPLAFVCFPPMLWAAMRFRQAGAATGAFILAGIALWGTLRGGGSFAVNDRNNALLIVQAFSGTIMVTHLILAAVVAERGVARDALRRSDERLRLALAAAQARAWEWTAGDRLDNVPQTVEDDGAVERIHPDDIARVSATRQRSLAEGGRYDTQYRVIRSDGSVRWRRSMGHTLGPGHNRRLVGIAMDITAGKQVEEALRASQEELALVTDSMAAQVARCTRDLTYAWVSKAYADMLGVPAEQIVGRPIVEVVGRDVFDRIHPYVTRVLAGEAVKYDAEVAYPGRAPRWINAAYTPTRSESGEIVGWVAVITDVDTRKRTEHALQEADRRKDEFLAILAHELRNPLAPIRTAVTLLRKTGDATAPAQELHEIIDRQSGQMARLLDDLLDVSRITSGKIVLRKERLGLRTVIAHAVESSRPLIESQGHRLSLDLPADPLYLDADLARLSQVFANLLNNAAKYTDGAGEIGLSAEREGHRVVVRVRDNGIGIPREQLTPIFEMFTQVESSLERTRGGLGIGLTLVQRLVQLHGGEVEAFSAGAGQGSEFVVRLPLIADPLPAACRASPLDGPVASEALRILIADDNVDSANLLAKLLKLAGHDVRIAHDGQQALEMATAFQPDVALLDIGMPLLNGYEVARGIRTQFNSAQMMLVAMTGWGQEEDKIRAREAGFDHHLTKPADLNTLESLIARAAHPAS